MSNFTPILRYTKNRSKSVSHFVICKERDKVTARESENRTRVHSDLSHKKAPKLSLIHI